jgi:hypothetical protein
VGYRGLRDILLGRARYGNDFGRLRSFARSRISEISSQRSYPVNRSGSYLIRKSRNPRSISFSESKTTVWMVLDTDRGWMLASECVRRSV